MAMPRRLKKTLIGAAGPALAAIAVVAMAVYAVFGPTGLYAWGDYNQGLAKREVELAVLKREEAVLRNRVALLNPRNVDPDMAEETIRRELGVAHPDEVIIPLN